MSKGSKRRPGDDDAYAREYERIFGPHPRLDRLDRQFLREALDALARDAQEQYGAYRRDETRKEET